MIVEKCERTEREESPIAHIICAEASQETIEQMKLNNSNIHVGQYLSGMLLRELSEQKLPLACANVREQS